MRELRCDYRGSELADGADSRTHDDVPKAALDYEEYLFPAERAPAHLPRIHPAENMKVQLVSEDPITNR
jgi:hypothetical protein